MLFSTAGSTDTEFYLTIYYLFDFMGCLTSHNAPPKNRLYCSTVFCWSQPKVCIRAKWPSRSELIPVSVVWSDKEYFYFPLDGMLVRRRVTPSIKFAGTHLYTWVERGTVRVKCLAQKHNTMSPARARTRTARSGVKCANHEVTAPPQEALFSFENNTSINQTSFEDQ